MNTKNIHDDDNVANWIIGMNIGRMSIIHAKSSVQAVEKNKVKEKFISQKKFNI